MLYDEDALLETMIAKHCDWLNKWTKACDGDDAHVYAPDQFAKETNEHGWRVVQGVLLDDPDEPESLTLVAAIHDGDEGGPQILTGFFKADTMAYYKDKAGTVFTLDQIDWGNYSTQLAEGNCTFHHEELLGWTLRAMVQEFDTIHTLVLSEGKLCNTPEEGTIEGCEACETREKERKEMGW